MTSRIGDFLLRGGRSSVVSYEFGIRYNIGSSISTQLQERRAAPRFALDFDPRACA